MNDRSKDSEQRSSKALPPDGPNVVGQLSPSTGTTYGERAIDWIVTMPRAPEGDAHGIEARLVREEDVALMVKSVEALAFTSRVSATTSPEANPLPVTPHHPDGVTDRIRAEALLTGRSRMPGYGLLVTCIEKALGVARNEGRAEKPCPGSDSPPYDILDALEGMRRHHQLVADEALERDPDDRRPPAGSRDRLFAKKLGELIRDAREQRTSAATPVEAALRRVAQAAREACLYVDQIAERVALRAALDALDDAATPCARPDPLSAAEAEAVKIQEELGITDDSPPFRPAALDELAARGYRRVNMPTSEADQDIVSRVVRENMPKATTKTKLRPSDARPGPHEAHCRADACKYGDKACPVGRGPGDDQRDDAYDAGVDAWRTRIGRFYPGRSVSERQITEDAFRAGWLDCLAAQRRESAPTSGATDGDKVGGVHCSAADAKAQPLGINTTPAGGPGEAGTSSTRNASPACTCAPDEQDEWCPHHGRIEDLKVEMRSLRAQDDRGELLHRAELAGAALEVAIALAEEGWSYASPYFQEKWRCEERAQKLRRIASVTDAEPLPTQWAEVIMGIEDAALSVSEADR